MHTKCEECGLKNGRLLKDRRYGFTLYMCRECRDKKLII